MEIENPVFLMLSEKISQLKLYYEFADEIM